MFADAELESHPQPDLDTVMVKARTSFLLILQQLCHGIVSGPGAARMGRLLDAQVRSAGGARPAVGISTGGRQRRVTEGFLDLMGGPGLHSPPLSEAPAVPTKCRGRWSRWCGSYPLAVQPQLHKVRI